MARRTPEDEKNAAAQDKALELVTLDADEAAKAGRGMPGGALGFIPDAVTQIRGLPTPPRAPQEPGDAVVERFRIVGRGSNPDGSYKVVDGGCLISMRPGNTVTSVTHDLDALRAQGVELQEIKG